MDLREQMVSSQTIFEGKIVKVTLDQARLPDGALAAREVDGQAEILVRDYGRGIPREELDKVCQPFYMVDKSRSRKAGGVGLGLALCREIVSVHGGTMDIDSRLGEGTLVTLRFPLSADQRGGKHLAEP